MVHRVLPVLVALMPVIAACGGTSDTEPTDDTVQAEIPTDLALVAQFTCNQLRGVAAGGAAPVITKELTRVASLGYTGSEFRDAMRSECPDTIGPLESDADVSSLFEG
jgi:hypothetical protein